MIQCLRTLLEADWFSPDQNAYRHNSFPQNLCFHYLEK